MILKVKHYNNLICDFIFLSPSDTNDQSFFHNDRKIDHFTQLVNIEMIQKEKNLNVNNIPLLYYPPHNKGLIYYQLWYHFLIPNFLTSQKILLYVTYKSRPDEWWKPTDNFDHENFIINVLDGIINIYYYYTSKVPKFCKLYLLKENLLAFQINNSFNILLWLIKNC